MDFTNITPARLEQRWLQSLGSPLGTAVMRQVADDFVVEEIPLVEPEGEGEHVWLWVEKIGANTSWVATQLAKNAGLRVRDVSFAGRKDRHARTRQYFSLHMPGQDLPAWSGWEIEGVRVLSATRHLRKLRRGTLAGNRFELWLREVKADAPAVQARLELIAAGGVPNYFGPQRFGRNAGNLYKANLLLAGQRRFPRDLQNILVSAARSFLFNEVLAARTGAGNWNQLLAGDEVQLAGSQSQFLVAEPDPELTARCSSFDITPTGPLPGETEQVPVAIEAEVLARYAEWVQQLCRMRIAATRRPLRVRPGDLEWRHEDDTLVLKFTLPAGSFATAVLRELLDCEDRAAA